MLSPVVDRFRRPEHTGENRCLPCTVVNVVLALALSLTVAAAGVATGDGLAGIGSALALVGLSVAVIYLRGYLIPGTPALTRRYFPAWLLRRFGKAPSRASSAEGPGSLTDDPVGWLTASGVLVDGAGGPSMSAPFRESYRTALATIDDATPADIATGTGDWGVEGPDALREETWGDAYRLYDGSTIVGKWRSTAAARVDFAAARALAGTTDSWATLDPVDRVAMLDAVRRSLDTCPDCGGSTPTTTSRVQGCCASHETRTVDCEDCDVRLYIGACPDCGGETEYRAESTDHPDGDTGGITGEQADGATGDDTDGTTVVTRWCMDCDRTRVGAVPQWVVAPPDG